MYNEQLLFSIVIPTYNRANLLNIAINSVCNQSYSRWELIIIDDASTDHTIQILNSFRFDQRIRFLRQLKSERSLARNKGIENARGDYICFLDDDDHIKPEYLMDFYQATLKYPETILRTGFIYQFADKTKMGKLYDPQKYQHPVKFAINEMCGVWSLCIPRLYLQSEKFADFPHWQDTHLILRLFAKYPVMQLSTYNYIYVQHTEMGTQKIFKNDEEIEKRLFLNLAAIEDFFKHHSALVCSIISSDTEKRLRSQKILHYAISTAGVGNKPKAYQLFRRSVKTGILLANFKLYLVFFKNYFFRLN